MSDMKKTYRVKEGRVFGANDEYKPGDTVELTDAEAKGFLDTVELIGSTKEKVAKIKEDKKTQ